MTSTKELSALLTTLYAAPLEPEKWQVFLDHLCILTNISSAYLIGSHPIEGNLVLAGGGLNFDPEVFHLYNEHYGANDPYRQPLMLNPRVGLIQGDDLVSHATLVESELYNEVLSQYGLEYMTMLSCNCSNEHAELLSLWRGPKHGPMDHDAIHLLESLVPHIQTALRLRKKVVACNASNLFSEAALNAMSVAAYLVTSKGRVCHMNRRAAAYLEAKDGICLDRSRLAATDSLETAQLEKLLHAATSHNRTHVGASPGGAMTISRPAKGTQLQLVVIPAPERNQIAENELCAVVFVSDSSSAPGTRAILMRQLYRLTPSEGRLADLLLEGLDMRDAAQRLHITIETARFHLKRILAKTSTRRQSELMRLMLSLPDDGSLNAAGE